MSAILDMGEVLAAELGEAVLAIPGPLRTVLFVRAWRADSG